jgi:hypothetical protein
MRRCMAPRGERQPEASYGRAPLLGRLQCHHSEGPRAERGAPRLGPIDHHIKALGLAAWRTWNGDNQTNAAAAIRDVFDPRNHGFKVPARFCRAGFRPPSKACIAMDVASASDYDASRWVGCIDVDGIRSHFYANRPRTFGASQSLAGGRRSRRGHARAGRYRRGRRRSGRSCTGARNSSRRGSGGGRNGVRRSGVGHSGLRYSGLRYSGLRYSGLRCGRRRNLGKRRLLGDCGCRRHEAGRQGIIVRHRPITPGPQHCQHGDDGGRHHDPTIAERRHIHQRRQGGQARCGGGEVESVEPLLNIGGTTVALPTKTFA